MKKCIFYFILLLITIGNVNAANVKNLEWLKTFGGDSIDHHFAGICDKSGNIFLTAGVKSPVLNLGNGNVFTSKDTNSNYFVLVKLSNDGVCQLFRAVNFSSGDYWINSMKVDSSGNIIIIGYAKILNTYVDFGNGNIISGKTVKSIILLKYSPTGDCIWAKCFDGDSQDIDGVDLCIGKNDNIYISGHCNNVDFGNGISFKKKMPQGGHLIAEFNKDGQCQWAKQLTTSDYIRWNGSIKSIRYGSDGSLYTMGYFQSKMDFGDGNYILKMDTTNQLSSIFLANYTSNGKLNWVKVYGSNFPCEIFSPTWDVKKITMDIDINNNIYIGGIFNADGYFANGYPLKFIQDTLYNIYNNTYENSYFVKCNSKGDIKWLRTFNGGYQGGSYEEINDILVEDVNNIYVNAWTFSYSINIDGFKFNNRKTGLSGYIAAFDSNGTCHQLNTLSSHGFGTGNLFEDGYKNLFVFGLFLDTLFTRDTYYTSHKPMHWDFFLPKYGSGCGINSFSYSDFSDIKYLSLVNSAQKIDSVVRLTPAMPQKQGAIWNTDQVYVRNGFTTEFKFRFSNPYNAFEDGSLPGADGIAFVIQNVNPTACGTNGGGIGFEGIANSLAVEFDTYKNSDPPYNDADGNHVAVFCNGKQPNTSNHKSKANLGTTNNIIPMRADSTVYYAKIDYIANANKLDIYLDSTGLFLKPVLTIDSIDLSKLIDLQDGLKAFAGITSATGTSYENQDILEWSVCSSAINTITDVKENNVISENGDIFISPNPSSEFIFLEINPRVNPGVDYSQIKLYSIEGIEVYNEPSEGFKPAEGYKIDVSSFAPGVYYVKIGDMVCRFIKM